jgi:hypothetical protein
LRGGCDWLKIFDLGASYKTFVIQKSGNLDFVNFLSLFKKFLHGKEKNKNYSFVFDDAAVVYGN